MFIRNNNRVLIASIICICFLSLPASATFFISSPDGGWEWQYPKFPANGLYQESIQFIDSHTGWGIGRGGIIYKTTNGGLTWAPQYAGDGLRSLFFLNKTTGWAAGENGAIYKTVDSGATWCRYNCGTKCHLSSVCFANADCGWVVGSDLEDTHGLIFKTTDGGVTWTKQVRNDVWRLRRICCADTDNGWALGEFRDRNTGHYYSVLLKTTDGGTTWTSHQIVDDNFLNISFIDSKFGWARGGLWSYKTSDGGETWTRLNTASTPFYTSTYFINSSIGWYADSDGNVYRTDDGGDTWTQLASIGPEYIAWLLFADANTGWMTTSRGLLKTTDGGTTWGGICPEPVHFLFDVDFINESLGWAVGHGGAVYKTIDGGANWIDQSSDKTNGWLYEVQFINANKGWISGDKFLMTNDGGANWESIQFPNPANVRSYPYFVDANYGWAGSVYPDINAQQDKAQVLKTTDGGASWVVRDMGMAGAPSSFKFTDYNTGWAVVTSPYNACIVKTTDGGDSWVTQYCMNGSESSDIDICDIFFINDTLGWAVGTRVDSDEINHSYTITSFVLSTTNGGTTWHYQKLPVSGPVSSVRFFDNGSGWIDGNYFVLHTNDGGNTWRVMQSPLQGVGIYGSCFLNPDMAWVVGNEGASGEPTQLMRTTTAGFPGCVWAKQQEDGKAANFGSLIVTAKFPGYIYAEHPNRAGGIRININDTDADIGDFIYVHGTIGSTSGERCINASSIDIITEDWGQLPPVSLNNSAVGGGPYARQGGVWGWMMTRGMDGKLRRNWQQIGGANNIGLLIRTWGRVTDAAESYFTIDDGSGQNIKCTLPAGIALAKGQFITVTGISSCEQVSNELHRLIRVRDVLPAL